MKTKVLLLTKIGIIYLLLFIFFGVKFSSSLFLTFDNENFKLELNSEKETASEEETNKLPELEKEFLLLHHLSSINLSLLYSQEFTLHSPVFSTYFPTKDSPPPKV